MTTVSGLWPTRLANRRQAPTYSPVPQDVSIEITGRCQLRCRHCFNHSGPDNRQELPLEVIERVLNEMVPWGVTTIRLSGGEPTIHRQFVEVVEACRARGISIIVNTNGIYSSSMLRYLRSAPIDLIIVSIDGLERNNDEIRGAGMFRRAVASCRALVASGRRVMIGVHIGSANRTDVEGLVALARSLGVGIKFAPIRPIGRAREEMKGALIEPADYYEVVRAIESIRRREPGVEIRTDFDILGDTSDSDCYRDPARASCKAGRTMVNINSDGRVYPCAFFTTPEGAFAAGNVFESSVTEVWQRPGVFEPFRVHTKSPTCQGCGHYQSTCTGGCPAISHFSTGVLDALDPTCFAGLVQEGGS